MFLLINILVEHIYFKSDYPGMREIETQTLQTLQTPQPIPDTSIATIIPPTF